MSEFIKDESKKRDFVSPVMALVATSGAVMLFANREETTAALTFLGPDGQAARESYVTAQDIQENLVQAREAQKDSDQLTNLVNGIVTSPRLQKDVVTLTNEPLSDNAWLTPEEAVASPLQGIIGLALVLAGTSAVASRRLTRRQKTR